MNCREKGLKKEANVSKRNAAVRSVPSVYLMGM
jgi:hypothetical protein